MEEEEGETGDLGEGGSEEQEKKEEEVAYGDVMSPESWQSG